MNVHINRREFIKNILRGAILVSAIALVSILTKRNQVKPTKECTLSYEMCKKCSKLDNCELPQAQTEKDKRVSGVPKQKKGWIL